MNPNPATNLSPAPRRDDEPDGTVVPSAGTTKVVPSPRVATKVVTELDRPATCVICGQSIPVQWNGRPRLYCGAACKQLAYRRRTSKVTP